MGLLAISLVAMQVYREQMRYRSLQSELILISSAEFELFNVDFWAETLVHIVSKKVDAYKLTPKDRLALEQKVTELLDELATTLLEANRAQLDRERGLFRKFKKNIEIEFIKIFYQSQKENFPALAKKFVDYLEQPENRKQLVNYLKKLLEEARRGTKSKVDEALLDSLVIKHGYQDLASTKAGLREDLAMMKAAIQPYQFAIIAFGILAIGYLMFKSYHSNAELASMMVISMIFLGLGVGLPMLSLDARILHFEMKVLGEDIILTDQVLFFKSKSILEVFWLMINQGSINLTIVGVLIVTFSVIFPLIKIMIMFRNIVSNNGITKQERFFLERSSKWSMADVMVVAIFMAYIGFKALVDDQLSQLNINSSNIQLLTMNHSSVEFGFYAFFIFLMISLVLSSIFKK